MDNPMKQIPSEIKIPYDALLVKRGVPLTVHFYYKKWLRYYLDFCFKYHHEKSKKESLSYFINKLNDKNQNEQQQKQAFHAISIFYEIKNTEQVKIAALNNKKENITTKKPVLKLISADWRPVYKNLESEIKRENGVRL